MQISRVTLGAQFNPTHVAHPYQAAVGRRAQDEILEVFWRRQPSGGVDAHLVGLPAVGRGMADRAGGDLDVLLGQGVDDVLGVQIVVGETLRVDPQAHRVLALAEDDYVADARNALEIVADV